MDRPSTLEESVDETLSSGSETTEIVNDEGDGWEDPFKDIGTTLASMPLFSLCGTDLPLTVACQAERLEIGAGKPLFLKNNCPMHIVERGALQIRVGAGPDVIVGPGTVLNCVGMLGLCEEAEPFRPRPAPKKEKDQAAIDQAIAETKRATLKTGAYEAFSDPNGPPVIFQDRRKTMLGSGHKGKVSSADFTCFYNVCPTAGRSSTAMFSKKVEGWLPIKIVGAAPDVVPSAGGRPNAIPQGGAVVAEIPLRLIEEVGFAGGKKSERAVALRAALLQMKHNSEDLANKWRTVISRCCNLLPGVPPEVTWLLAQGAEHSMMEAGATLIEEGDTSEACESLILIDEGVAIVEKIIGSSGPKISSEAIGRLGPGAIIGDICFVGGGIPRAATVIAKSLIEVVTIPKKVLLATMQQFPGLFEGVQHRMKEAGLFMQMRLQMRQDTLETLQIFAKTSFAAVADLANCGDRRLLYCGQEVVENEEDKNAFFVIEFGECCMQTPGEPNVKRLAQGSCFGDHSEFGILPGADSTVRVSTPIASLLKITLDNQKDALGRHMRDWVRFNSEAPAEPGSNIEKIVKGIPVFRDCGPELINEIFEAMENRCYMPGQTITVEGAQDASQMFILRGGQLLCERGGKRLPDIAPGQTFGDLAMLGAMRRRPSTIRALTFSHLIEIPREAFLASIKRHPDELQHFEHYAVTAIQTSDKERGIKWPVLHSAPPRLLYLLNLFAGRRICPVEDPYLAKRTARESAILVLHGRASLLNHTGEEVAQLEGGMCFNEQVLLGIRCHDDHHVVPRTVCEIQILSKEIWAKVIAEFPEDKGNLEASIMMCMAKKVEDHKDATFKGLDVLRQSSLFRSSSVELLQALYDRMGAMVLHPGDTITEQGQKGDRMYILLGGTATMQNGKQQPMDILPGKVIGEAVVADLCATYSGTVIANSLCTLRFLRKSDFWEICSHHDTEREMLGRLLKQCRKHDGSNLAARMVRTVFFSQIDREFVNAICTNAEDVFFAPGETIMHEGDPTMLGKVPLYVLFAGQVDVEGVLGVRLSRLSPGAIFGEAGALGAVEARTATVRAAQEGIVFCVRIHGGVLENALRTFSEERVFLEKLWDDRKSFNGELYSSRDIWIRDTVVPLLGNTPLLAGCPESILARIAAPLQEEIYDEGEIVAPAGAAADSMLVIMEGSAVLEAKSGKKVGTLTEGAAWGEVCALGLLPVRLATLTAQSTCKVLPVTSSAIKRALDSPDAEQIQTGFERLIESRHHQVARGIPMCQLPISLNVDDVSARAIALQAECIHLQPGQCWYPLPDTDPCGPHFGVLVRGRVVLESAAEKREVLTLNAGSLLLEGLGAECGAQVRALTYCEGYRVRQSDLLLAVATVPGSQEWYYRFRLLEREARRHLQMRVTAIRGVTDAVAPHPCDDGIHMWKARKEEAMLYAHLSRLDRSGEVFDTKQLRARSLKKSPSAPQLCTAPHESSVEGGESIKFHQASTSTLSSGIRMKRPGSMERLARRSQTILRLPKLTGSR